MQCHVPRCACSGNHSSVSLSLVYSHKYENNGRTLQCRIYLLCCKPANPWACSRRYTCGTTWLCYNRLLANTKMPVLQNAPPLSGWQGPGDNANPLEHCRPALQATKSWEPSHSFRLPIPYRLTAAELERSMVCAQRDGGEPAPAVPRLGGLQCAHGAPHDSRLRPAPHALAL